MFLEAPMKLCLVCAHVLMCVMTSHSHTHHLHRHHSHENRHHGDLKTCPEDVVEWKTRSGEIIFIGTIRKIVRGEEVNEFGFHSHNSVLDYDDSDNKSPEAGLLNAVVEVKRLLRGGHALNNLPDDGGHELKRNEEVKVGMKVVVVEGLNDPEICRQYEPVQPNDTRLFFTVVSDKGSLRLNSSLVKFSLKNVEIFEMAVKEMLYLHKAKNELYEKSMKLHRSRSESIDLCANKTCQRGSTCVLLFIGSELSVRCQCPDFCRNSTDNFSVCGTNGLNYKSSCEIENLNCRENRNVKVKFPGNCDPCSSFLCQERQICVVDSVTRQPSCRCGSACPMNFDPVCGNDGKTYINECKLKEIACINNEDVWVLYKEGCSGGENPCFGHACAPHETCRVDHTNSPVCFCPTSCSPIYVPICGSDKNTYDSDCHWRMQSCLYKGSILKRHPGECRDPLLDPCLTHLCPPNLHCVVKDDQPVCEEEYKPGCTGEYLSNCKTNCKTNGTACNSPPTPDPCLTVKCNFHSKCVTDLTGGTECVCKESCANHIKKEMCGTDGKTYQNACEMEHASCRQRKDISKIKDGPCDACHGVICQFGGACENGSCTCNFYCEPNDLEPVCGDDGRDYPNFCFMRMSGCKREKHISVAHYGYCGTDGNRIEDSFSGSGDSSEHSTPMCDTNNCKHGGFCAAAEGGGRVCMCGFNCEAIREKVCGTDGKIYGNECLMKVKSCERQYPIEVQSKDLCEDIDEEICDGGAPLKDHNTGLEYSCTNGTCPPDSFCHKLGGLAKCCSGESPIKSCQYSTYGCCRDGRTTSKGPNFAGCDSLCQCNFLGSVTQDCNSTSKECKCKVGVGGPKCDRCASGFWGFPKIAEGSRGCIPCECNKLGSFRGDCEQVNGRCQCRTGFLGQKCDLCQNGRKITSAGCPEPRLQTTARPNYHHHINTNDPTIDSKMKILQQHFTTSTHTIESTVPSFSGNSSFVLKLPDNFAKSLSVSIKFKPAKEDGLIIFVGDNGERRKDYYFVAIKSGYVIFKYNLGSGPATMTSSNRVRLGSWHQLKATRFGREGTLRLDDGPQESGTSSGTHNILDHFEANAFVGDVVNKTALSITHFIGLTDGFHGCIEYLNMKTHKQAVEWNFTGNILEKIKEKVNIGKCGECSKNLCQNGGICRVNDVEEQSCKCPPGFFGEQCEVKDPCVHSPCRNSGRCVALENGTFSCVCRMGFRGAECENDRKRHAGHSPITMPEFQGRSIISASLLNSISLVRSFSVKIWFLFNKPSGVLMSASSGDSTCHVVILLQSAVVQLFYKIRKTSEMLISPRVLTSGRWNRVHVAMTNGQGLLIVNDDHPIMKHAPVTSNYLERSEGEHWPTDWKIHFGGGHESLSHVVKNVSGFHGAFQRIYINGVQVGDILQPITFKNDKTLLKIESYRNLSQYEGFPCSSVNNCGSSGTCIPVLNDFLCKCPGRNATQKSCQVESNPVNFDGDTVHGYQLIGMRRIQIRFKSQADDGVLFYFENPFQQIKAIILKHILLVEVHVGNRSSMLLSSTNVSDGVWRKVLIENEYDGLKLYVDSVRASTSNIQVPTRASGTIWIGGAVEKDIPNFVGCVESVWLNNVRIDLWKDRIQKHAVITPCV